MTNTTQTQVRSAALPARTFTVSQSTGAIIRSIFTYTILFIGAAIMIFPMLWMLGASLKPEWQILTQPLAFPSEWVHVQAGNTNQEFPLWRVTDPAGNEIDVIQIGTRRFTTVIDAAALTGLIAVPTAELSDAQPAEFGEVVLNVRTWTRADGSTQQVVALARDGDNLVVSTVDALQNAAQVMPLAEANAGQRAQLEIEGYRFQGRTLADERTLIVLGPESQQTVVAPAEVAAQAFLVPADAPVNPEPVKIGATEVTHYNLTGRPENEYYVVLSSEAWQPIIDMDVLREHGFVISASDVPDAVGTREFGNAQMPVYTLTGDDEITIEVVELLRSGQRVFVIPVEHTESLSLSPLGKLTEPFVQTIDNVAVRYKDDYGAHGENLNVAIVGTQQNMALVVSQEAITAAFDVPSDALTRELRPRLYIENFIDALSRDLGGATFFTFFGNSIKLVVLNLVGHFLSVTIVAYGFARLHAPGKNLLFMILLATMMMPFPVLLIPTYEIFQAFGMINTHWPLFIRAFFGNAFLIFLLRQFFMGIPLELEDAARIDGANTLQILWYVMLPLSKPALATIGIFTFWWTWNAFFEPYVYLSSIKNFTVSLGLGFFKSQYTYTFHLLMAASVITIFPIITIFFFAQRYFIEGIQLSGLKG
ncbi:MAG TPA: ABC transporter permease subunit [Spirillospora sp.]|nr:ABC transporter permease subunit [Spirillospora sp.]